MLIFFLKFGINSHFSTALGHGLKGGWDFDSRQTFLTTLLYYTTLLHYFTTVLKGVWVFNSYQSITGSTIIIWTAQKGVLGLILSLSLSLSLSLARARALSLSLSLLPSHSLSLSQVDYRSGTLSALPACPL